MGLITNRGLSAHTISHLLPSSANLAGFLPMSACGLLGLTGRFPATVLHVKRATWIQRTADLPAGEEAVAGTVPLARRAGFLCVISLLSTLRKPFVTSSPRLSCSNTAEIPPAAGAGAPAGGGGGATGGGGGGGGGGAPPAVDDLDWNSDTERPCTMQCQSR